MVWVFGGFDIAAKNEDAGKAFYAIDQRRFGPFALAIRVCRTARLVQIVFDQSISASLGDPIIDQLAAYRARDHEAASYEPV
jgi:hypothetical protein